MTVDLSPFLRSLARPELASAPHDEQEFTPHAARGWTAWNAWSPEVEFCTFVGALQRMLQPQVILETGVGIGRITQFLCLGEALHFGFESDEEWRCNPNIDYRPEPTPTAEQMAAADLVILDSGLSYRLDEIALWACAGKHGSVCVIHDAGNGHSQDPQLVHNRVRAAIEHTGKPGMFLKNPRGAWIGLHR
ncbi:hypothetical protein H7H78_10400 [Mycobacterium shinjukuense]|uniref:Uncharacterized protein n=1 Tax=Mycobacterium shinjukuense TaxID=398694 RepID=A0A7I7MNI5_9MYCO|nr:hypothetical protein [Mycobacterium shinjukuense]MCV6985825.1 hypothetical protein [Mycobacterium shinjukuense]ORB71772.1 hypothetical protein BST45_01955 [Mycobacterium shinjukuense]BBX73705.1 hypothetical protein MSHI_16110 [Mycobacterium shinjukuense]